MSEEIKKTDAGIRIGMLEEAKRELLSKMAEHEKNLKILLTQIKTMQRLIEEAQSDMEHEAKEKIIDMQEEIDKQTEVLEEMLDKTQTAKKDAREIFGEEIDKSYKGSEPSYRINEDVLTTAASGASSNRLRELQYKSNWSKQDAADFFAIKDSVSASAQYDLNPFLKENVDETYRALKDVISQQEKQIRQNYQTDVSKQFQSQEFFRPMDMQPKISTDYKPINQSYKTGSLSNTSNSSQTKSSGLEKQLDKKD
ncbi:hypothetical protein JXA48_04485 [Candidatus Woesearchaeota archaeon]|nr:hypothetical protein [Candidatus Woesearchaeota archaeon]